MVGILCSISCQNQDLFIPGKGCGITTPIKILQKMPENIKDMSCVIIKKENQIDNGPITGMEVRPCNGSRDS